MPVQPQIRFLERIHYQQGTEPTFVPHYDSKSGDLRAWLWPTTQTEARVHPMEMSEYRSTRELNNPCCLCASEEYEDDYTESAIYISSFGPYSGKYVAGCASNSCGYLIDMECMYSMENLLRLEYPMRASGAPSPILYLPTIGGRDTSNLFRGIPFHQLPPADKHLDAFDKFLKLDSPISPGLLEHDFRKLFWKCRCGTVATRRAFKHHVCRILPDSPIVVDLTVSDGDSDFVMDH